MIFKDKRLWFFIFCLIVTCYGLFYFSDEQILKRTALDYSYKMRIGDYDSGYLLTSELTKKKIPKNEFTAYFSSSKDNGAREVIQNINLHGDTAEISLVFVSSGRESNFYKQKWVRESDGWRRDFASDGMETKEFKEYQAKIAKDMVRFLVADLALKWDAKPYGTDQILATPYVTFSLLNDGPVDVDNLTVRVSFVSKKDFAGYKINSVLYTESVKFNDNIIMTGQGTPYKRIDSTAGVGISGYFNPAELKDALDIKISYKVGDSNRWHDLPVYLK